MKTKKELRDEQIARYLWNEKKNRVILVTLLIAIVVVGIWKWDRVSVDFYTFAKIFVTSIGIGYCLGNVLCHLLFHDKESLIENARCRHHQKYQTFWMRYLQHLSEEERKKLPEKVRLRSDRLDLEARMLYNEFDL